MNNAEWEKLCKPLHIVHSGRMAAIIRQHARAQVVTYASMVRAAVKQAMDKDGGEYVMAPWGTADFIDCYDATHEMEE